MGKSERETPGTSEWTEVGNGCSSPLTVQAAAICISVCPHSLGQRKTLQNKCVEVVSSWEWAVVDVSLPDWATMVCYVAMVALVATLPMAKMERRVWKEKI